MKKRLLFLTVMMTLLTVTAVAAGSTPGRTVTAKAKAFTLVIDAGHGGNDTGAIGALTKEKTINLNVALAFGRLVERNCSDVKVIYTRKTDVFIPLHTRADIANRNKADLFISIHTNSLPKGHVSRGMETYTLGMHRAADNLAVAKRENEVILYEKDYKQRYQGFDPNSSESYIMFEFMQDHNMAQSVELAKFVQKRTCASAGRQNKGVKQAGFLVLRETSMPSCLIELGFISTPDEERFLNSNDGVSRLAQGIYQAFLDYKRKHNGGTGIVVKDAPKEVKTAPKAEVAPVPKAEGKMAVAPKAEEKPAVAPKAEGKTAVAPKAEGKPAVTPKAEEKKKSKMAQELADAREGKLSADTAVVAVKSAPKADSIVAVTTVAAKAPTQPTALNKPTPPNTSAKATPSTKSTAPLTPPAPSALLATEPVASAAAPVFKVQILASTTKLKTADSQLKGQKDVDCYQEGGLYKYTIGSSTNYNEIYQLRKSLLSSFPKAFIIAFKDGVKMNVQTAIQEYKANKK